MSSQRQSIDGYREQVEAALAAGASKAAVARALGIPSSTLTTALDRWSRPERPRPGEEALEALRRLVDQ